LAVEGRSEREAESDIIAAKDQALQTKYRVTKILQTDTGGQCSICQLFDEAVEHIISACPILAEENYVKKHDRVCAQLHFNVCK